MVDLVDEPRLVPALRALRAATFDAGTAPAVQVGIDLGVRAALAGGDPDLLEAVHDELAGALAAGWGSGLSDHDPDSFGRLTEHLPRLAAATHLDVEALLDSYGGKPRRVLEVLASAPPDGLLQSQVQTQLDIAKDYLSKVVGRLADADLVLRAVEGAGRRLVITATGRRALRTGGGAATAAGEVRITHLDAAAMVSKVHDLVAWRAERAGVGYIDVPLYKTQPVVIHKGHTEPLTGVPEKVAAASGRSIDGILRFDFPNVLIAKVDLRDAIHAWPWSDVSKTVVVDDAAGFVRIHEGHLAPGRDAPVK